MASDRMVRVIGAFKLVKSAALLAFAAGALAHVQHDVAAHLRGLVGGEHVRHAIAKLDGARDGEADKLGVFAFTYAALFAIEGTGLLLRKVWGEWLTIVITGSFVPIEIYELVEKRSITKVIVVALNVAVVVYLLVRRLHASRGHDAPAPTPA